MLSVWITARTMLKAVRNFQLPRQEDRHESLCGGSEEEIKPTGGHTL